MPSSRTSTDSKPPSGPGKSKGCGTIRPSRRGRWRAGVLILVHVLVVIHLLHWWLTGSTLTPVEPSEAMQTLGEGLVNAGFVLFVVLIVSTFVFGRFFCGWGCHVVALQDLCTWLLQKIGIRPRPLRSRLLVWVPLFAALYMFLWPTLKRWWAGNEAPEWRAHFVTEDFWATFPGWGVAIVTFGVCGFLIVYFLGNKGFCTYGCPYGGIFGVADKVAPGKIRVTDACEGCAHCTAACTSNVRVHEEVRTWGMVVDTGCMKCMDCVDVCPKGALYFGFGRTAANKGQARQKRPARKYDFSWREEIALAGIFLFSIVALTLLYWVIPFLLALGLSAIGSFALLAVARLFYMRDVRFGRFRLCAAGKKTRAGNLFLVVLGLWALFLCHSAFVQYSTHVGLYRVEEALRRKLQFGESEAADWRAQLEAGVSALERAEAWGLIAPPSLLVWIASSHSQLGNAKAAMDYYGRAADAQADYAVAHFEYGQCLARTGRPVEATEYMKRAIREDPDLPGAPDTLATLLIENGRVQEAVVELKAVLDRRPLNVDARLAYGVVLSRLGRHAEGLAEVGTAIGHDETNPRGHFVHAQLRLQTRELRPALASLERVIQLAPTNPKARSLFVEVSVQLGDWAPALEQLNWLCNRDPFNSKHVATWARGHEQLGSLPEAIRTAEASRDTDRSARFRLLHLYRIAGRTDEATALEAEFQE